MEIYFQLKRTSGDNNGCGHGIGRVTADLPASRGARVTAVARSENELQIKANYNMAEWEQFAEPDRIFYLIYMHMRTTLNIDDKILEKASRLTGIKEKTSLVRLGLEALIARESSRRLAKLGGTEKKLRSIPRRRSS